MSLKMLSYTQAVLHVRLIPFAQNGGGDLFCFLYEENEEEPRIVLYYHDDYSGPVLEASSFDEFIYVILLEIPLPAFK